MTSDGEYITLKITPTVTKNTTEYNAEGIYTDSNRIRFQDGLPEQLGGWQRKITSRAFNGVARDIHNWVELNGTQHYAVGTHLKLEIEQDGSVYDITPVDTSVSVSNAISTSAGSTLIIVSAAGHARNAGDYLIFTSVATSVGGITFTGIEGVVTSVISADAIQVSVSTTAISTSANGGGATRIDFLLPIGRQSNGTASGYGAGTYGTSGAAASAGYGDPRGGTGISAGLTQWSLDNWGEDLIATRKNGKIYIWDASTSVQTRATAITAAPSVNTLALVAHPDRYLVAYGTIPEGSTTFDPMYVRWCDRENYNQWSAQATNRAGGIRLEGGSFIVGVTHTKQETLIFTDTAVYTQRPTNDSLVFSFDLQSLNAGLISQHGAASIDSAVFWIGPNNFFMYDGQVKTLPCTVHDFVFPDIEYQQKEKIFAGVCRQFSEIFWFYQSTSSTNDIDKYVKYNYEEGSWDVGILERTVWLDAEVYQHPVAVNTSGTIYDHEIGVDDDNSPMGAYIETSYFDLQDGTNVLLMDQFVPDFVQSGLAEFTIYTQKTPDGPVTTKGPYNLTTNTQYVNMKARGRQAKVRFATSTVGSNFKLGKPRYRVKPDGQR